MRIIDTHSHIHFKENFPDFSEVIVRAEQVAVAKQILVGCNLKDSLNALEFAQNYSGIYPTIGIHPHDSSEWNEKTRQIFRDILNGEGEFKLFVKKPVAIGEIGLDYFKNFQPVEVQKAAFQAQLQLAREFDLPAIIHVRDAFEDTFKILEKEGNTKVLLHCFSGGLKEAELAWSRGYIVSFSGVITYPKNIELSEVAKIAPLKQYVVETDCPFLSPQKYRGQRNEPAYVVETLKFIAGLRGISLEEAALETTTNAERFFGLK